MREPPPSDIRPGVRRLVRLALRRARGGAPEADADAEIRLHLQLRAEQLAREGWAPEAARAEAERRFGPLQEARPRLRRSARRREHHMRLTERLHELRQDLRYAWRGLRRAPRFTLVVLATLSLGIGAATAIFSVVHGVLLRPLPYAEPARLAAVYARFAGLAVERGNVSQPELGDLAALPALARVGAYGPGDLTVTPGGTAGGGEPERVQTLFVTAELFATLGRRAAVGRVFTPAEDRPGAEPVLVLGHGYWQRRFGGDTSVVGRTLVADGRAHAIVGVLPPDFAFGEAELYAPLALDPADAVTSRGAHNYRAVARLAPGATHAQLGAQLDALGARLRREHPASYPPGLRFALHALPLHEALVGDARGALRVLTGAVALLLLIACANAANLLLARGEGRRRELGVHAALGAGRGRVVRQLLTESALLAAGAGAIGLALGAATVRALLAVHPDALPRPDAVRLDPVVAGAALLLALLTGALFGVVPALRAGRADVHGLLRTGGRGGTARTRDGLRRALVVGELALAVVVVTAAGLLTRSFRALQDVDAGLDPRGVLTLATSLPSARYPAERVAPTYDALLDRVRALPGVRAAGAVGLLPLAGRDWNWDVIVEGRPRAPGAPAPSPRPQVVTPGALDALGATIVRGRGIVPADRADAPLVALVNETMARRVWRGADALGQRFRIDGDSTRWATVVGVVRDVRAVGLGEPAVPEFYVPLAQFEPFARWQMRSLTVLARTDAGDPARLAPSVRRALADVDPTLAASDVRTMRQVVDRSVARPRFTMLLLGAFGASALLLATVGVYGVVAYGVAARTREFGIRSALGARPSDVLRLVVGQGAALAVAGVALGLVGALAATRVLRALLFGVSATDPLTFAAIPLLLLAVAVLASVGPARRAMRAAPTVALRAD